MDSIRSKILVFLVLVLLLSLEGICEAAEANGVILPDRIILNVTENPAVSQSVTWRTNENLFNPQAQIVEAISSPSLGDKAITLDAETETINIEGTGNVNYHSVVFESLTPNTLYAYRVGSKDGWSEWNNFKTASGQPDPFSFIYLGDPQTHIKSMCSRVFRAAYQKAPEAAFWLVTGDVVNHGEEDSEWGEFFSALGWIARTTPMALLPGNHEYKKTVKNSSGLTYLWRSQFTLPQNGVDGVEESSYFFDYNGARIITLNGNEKIEEQAKWLKNILKNNPQQWTIVSIHQPFYSTAKGRDNPYHRMLFTKIFDKYSVDLVLQGHDHTYGRTHKVYKGKRRKDKGTVYVVSVSGPKQYASKPLFEDLMAKTGTQTQFFQVIKVQGNQLAYEAYTATGELYDSFKLSKEM